MTPIEAETVAGREEEDVDEVVVVEPARVGTRASRLLLLCDHASCRLPSGMPRVPDSVLQDHYGWDIGALGVARVVARELSSVLVRSNFSRLLIDPNRGLDADDLIREDLDLEINAAIDESERQRRISLFYKPYHRAIADVLDAEREIVAVVALHTFTPFLVGEWRKWEAGLIYDVKREQEVAFASSLMSFLRGEGFSVGDNEPYPPLAGDSLTQHGGERNLLGVGIEVRNDLVRVDATQEVWGVRLARALAGCMEIEKGAG